MKKNPFDLKVTKTAELCAIGEVVGRRNADSQAVPVMSCEGACIRGEIARVAANRLAKTPGYARACHGELFSVPGSEMARWVVQANQVVVIDGCHLKCHGRIVENIVGKERVRSFNAQARYRKYGDLFDIDDVPEPERHAAADDVVDWVNAQLKAPPSATADAPSDCAVTPPPAANRGCCGHPAPQPRAPS